MLGPDGLPEVEAFGPEINSGQLDTALSKAFSVLFGKMKNEKHSYSKALEKYPDFINK